MRLIAINLCTALRFIWNFADFNEQVLACACTSNRLEWKRNNSNLPPSKNYILTKELLST